jgi:hypothetical protein
MSSAARSIAPLILFAAIVLSFILAIVFGFVQLLWLGQPLGATGATIAFICLYVFSGASLLLLIFAMREQGKAGI